MKTKLYALIAVLAALLLPGIARAQIQLTGARVYGLNADGKRDGSFWNTTGNDGPYNVYFFTGTPAHHKFLNSGNTDDSLNPKLNLTPGTYNLGFACDSKSATTINLELCFNGSQDAAISVTARDGVTGELSGTTAFSAGDLTVRLTAIRTFDKHTDIVSPYVARHNGAVDTGGFFTLVVTRTSAPLASTVSLEDFKLTGDLAGGDAAVFTLTGNAHVEDVHGGSLSLVSGNVAFTSLDPAQKWRLVAQENNFVAQFDHRGVYPVAIHFNAHIRNSNDWRVVNFQVAPSLLQPIQLQGLATNTEFQFENAARPERQGNDFINYLPVDGTVHFAWKSAQAESEGKLFYAAEMLSQISVSPGLMSQSAQLDGKVMQGEMNQVAIRLRGAGEVTRVQGDAVLAWNVVPCTNSDDRLLVVSFNQPQKDAFSLSVQTQTPIGAFPQSVDALRLQPEGATRFAGSFLIVNDGAVRLEVSQASGLSQISPDQFAGADVFHPTGSQRFAYRFSSADFALRIQADQILPEVGVSQILAYNLGENELSVDAQIELDIREAPLRELLLHIPNGYVIAQITAAGMSDYFTSDTPGHDATELRLVYGQPISDRQLVQLRLERNQSLGETNWELPRIEVVRAKSVRGFVGVSADSGFRLTPGRTQSLTEIATAFFPGQLAGIQSAFRLSDANWQATLHVERLPQAVQADVFHLFSIGEGIAYGSSVINYVVSGAPVSTFHVELSDEYYNVEFTGQDVRNWEKTTNGYLVQLHTPVAGAYTLLATYERPFKSGGETLAFTGARPLDAQTESGHTIITSAYQFQVKTVAASPGLLALEPGEVPAEYRLFFDKPVLAAYQYSSRPFDLKLALSPLVQGDSIGQVVDRASLTTHISKEGQALTDVHYLIKNRGIPNFRLTLPEGTELWSAAVNGSPVVPVMDGASDLVPLPPHADPDTVLALDLKLAARAADAKRLTIAAPMVAAPTMLTEWKLLPDEGQRLVYRHGTLLPTGVLDVSGFAQIVRAIQGYESHRLAASFFLMLIFVGLGLACWRWAGNKTIPAFCLRHVVGTVIGFSALTIAVILFLSVCSSLVLMNTTLPDDLTFLAPVQQENSPLTVDISNVTLTSILASPAWKTWPAVLAVFAWIFSWSRSNLSARKNFCLLGWTLLAWAMLRLPNGAPAFAVVIGAFILVHLAWPLLKPLWRLPAKTQIELPPAETGPAPAITALFIALSLLAGAVNGHAADLETVMPDSVTQQIRIEDNFALVNAKIHWQAEKGQVLPLLKGPAVMTHVNYPKALKLESSPDASISAQQLVAQTSGTFDIEVDYQTQVTKSNQDTGLSLPLPGGLVNRATVSLVNQDVDVYSAQAVSVQRSTMGTDTVATLVLQPGATWIGWKPLSRDVKREKAVFYAEISQLYIPSAGVVDGIHEVAIRPAQGQLGELIFDIPAGATITDVTDWPREAKPSIVSLWRFDPDTRKLRVTLNPAQSRPFTLAVRSQVATGTLPFTQQVGLISLEGAAGQIGLLGVATGNEVQLDDVTTENFSAINLEDFPDDLRQAVESQISGLTVRRAFHYSDPQATAQLKASAVEPDVRVETQDTLSLGEDRSVLATTADVTITRAGIFKLSFLLPDGFDVESVSGAALSHWTELKTDAGRVITLNLSGKTDGQQQFLISLSGPGVKASRAWAAPKIFFREANKQRGTLLVVPEQGMRLQVADRDGVTQLDPQESGIAQKGVLAFRILETPWKLDLDIEQVDPWIQVTSLQQAIIAGAQVKVAANLQYQIENTGLKTLHVHLTTQAEGVVFRGDEVADFLAVDGAVTNGLQEWEIKLHRRIIGQYLLQVNYSTPLTDQAGEALVRGVLATDVNLQRGFATVESAGRLQLRVDNLPSSLQPTEWQGIPRALQKDLPAASASFAYRLVEPDFQLPLKLERHEAAKLLPAHVNNITFTSVISDAGTMLTEARLEILPGDKRLLHFTLPAGAKFWFAFVNQNGVWPWRQDGQILLPLEQQSNGDAPVPVEIFFSSDVGKAGAAAMDLSLIAPKFDLPLENLTWRVFLNDRWKMKKWTGALQFQQEELVADNTTPDFQNYLQNESSLQQEKTREAEQMLALGNSALQNGDPQQARRAFQSAYGLSTHDEAFNEDARVQLNNLKLQQALVGLNVRQATINGGGGGGGAAMSGTLRDLHNRNDANYTQEDAKQIIDSSSADENTAFMKLAERLIQQQDAAVASPAVIRANIPEQGRLLTFKRSVVVDTWADLNIGLRARAVNAAPWNTRALILALTVLGLAALGLLTRSTVKKEAI